MKRLSILLGMLAGAAAVGYVYGDKILEAVNKAKENLNKDEDCGCGDDCNCGDDCKCDEECTCDERKPLTKEDIEREIQEIKTKAVNYAGKLLDDLKKKVDEYDTNDIQELYEAKHEEPKE